MGGLRLGVDCPYFVHTTKSEVTQCRVLEIILQLSIILEFFFEKKKKKKKKKSWTGCVATAVVELTVWNFRKLCQTVSNSVKLCDIV